MTAPTPKWLQERRAEQVADRARSARPEPCPDCGGPTLFGQGEDCLLAKVRVEAEQVPAARRALLLTIAVLDGREVYVRQHGALHRADRMMLGLGPGQLPVRGSIGPSLDLHLEHRCPSPTERNPK